MSINYFRSIGTVMHRCKYIRELLVKKQTIVVCKARMQTYFISFITVVAFSKKNLFCKFNITIIKIKAFMKIDGKTSAEICLNQLSFSEVVKIYFMRKVLLFDSKVKLASKQPFFQIPYHTPERMGTQNDINFPILQVLEIPFSG